MQLNRFILAYICAGMIHCERHRWGCNRNVEVKDKKKDKKIKDGSKKKKKQRKESGHSEIHKDKGQADGETKYKKSIKRWSDAGRET
jgi:hypothetical protein